MEEQDGNLLGDVFPDRKEEKSLGVSTDILLEYAFKLNSTSGSKLPCQVLLNELGPAFMLEREFGGSGIFNGGCV